MADQFRSELRYDGSWWEAEIPPGWLSLGRDESKKGFPSKFSAPSGLVLFLHVNECSGAEMDVSFAPHNLSQTQKIAYAVAAHDCAVFDLPSVDPSRMNQAERNDLSLELSANLPMRLREAASKLKRVEYGAMVGFIAPMINKSEVGWHGYFAIETHWLNAWTSGEQTSPNDIGDALALLGSIVVQRPNPSLHRTASGGR